MSNFNVLQTINTLFGRATETIWHTSASLLKLMSVLIFIPIYCIKKEILGNWEAFTMYKCQH